VTLFAHLKMFSRGGVCSEIKQIFKCFFSSVSGMQFLLVITYIFGKNRLLRALIRLSFGLTVH